MFEHFGKMHVFSDFPSKCPLNSIFNIDLDLLAPCLTSDPETCKGEPTFIFHLNILAYKTSKSVKKWSKLIKLTSNIDLDLLAPLFDLFDPETSEGEPKFLLYSQHFGALSIEIG